MSTPIHIAIEVVLQSSTELLVDVEVHKDVVTLYAEHRAREHRADTNILLLD